METRVGGGVQDSVVLCQCAMIPCTRAAVIGFIDGLTELILVFVFMFHMSHCLLAALRSCRSEHVVLHSVYVI
jgi:hypothetical protein